MKHHIIRAFQLMLAGVALAACGRDDAPAPEPLSDTTIRVNTLAVDRAGATENDNTFMVLFWPNYSHLENPVATLGPEVWNPYLASQAPQPVAFYQNSVYDTGYPYPQGTKSGDGTVTATKLYATGYSPGALLQPVEGRGYQRLVAALDGVRADALKTNAEKLAYGARVSRCDFLGCDVWKEVWWGSLDYPFSKENNKLYYRHLGAKLVFYADRDRESMEGKQFVRNVEVTNLCMSTDGGATWTTMFTPTEFEWRVLPESYFGHAAADKPVYATVVDRLLGLNPAAAGTRPKAGYLAVKALPFAGAGSDYLLSKRATDRVPVSGMPIDSCYICNRQPYGSGAPETDQPIRLRMDIRAEMSYDFNFPKGDGTDGSNSDDLTFTREWKNMAVEAIYRVNIGENGAVNVTTDKITEFEPGCEYRVYLHFNRSGVNLAAWMTKWNFGGSHYVAIQGGEQTGTGQ